MSIKTIFAILFVLFLFASCKQSNEQLLDKGYKLSKQKKYGKAIEVYTEVIKRNSKLQLAYYNRGDAYLATKQYGKALRDFNKVMSLQTSGDYILTYNQDSPFADEETRAQVPYNDALFQAAQVKYLLDSLKSSFNDFQALINYKYEVSNCTLWQGTIYARSDKMDKACEYFEKAKQLALTEYAKNQADEMIKAYCLQTNKNH